MSAETIIRVAGGGDLDAVSRVERLAFSGEDEAEIVKLLLADPSAQPSLSLLAFSDGEPVGHILFTHAALEPGGPAAALLAPMAVVPAAQGQGVGGALIRAGLALQRERGVALVFVLGHPGYYPRHGFQPAMPLGLQPPYALSAEHAEAWMVAALAPDLLGAVTGRVVPAAVFRDPAAWGA